MSTSERSVDEIVEEFADKVVGVADTDGSYIYHLTRVKEAFHIGTMSLDDFVEIESGDEWLTEAQDWLRTTLLAERSRTTYHENSEKAVAQSIIDHHVAVAVAKEKEKIVEIAKNLRTMNMGEKHALHNHNRAVLRLQNLTTNPPQV